MDFNVENYLTNLSYINKDFPTLWNEILETVPKLTNKWIPNEANESDPLVVLLKELAIISDKLNYNVDKNILELFPATLTQERSAYNVYQSLGYTPAWYVSATTDLTIIYSGMINTTTPDVFPEISVGTTEVTLPKFTPVTNDDQTINYVTLENVVIYPGMVSKYTVPVIEGTINDFTINGSTQITVENLDSQNRLFFTETNVAQNGIFISNNSDFSDFNYLVYGEVVTDSDDMWERVDNLNQYEAGRKVYKLGIDAVNNSVYVQFPDDIGTLIEDGIYIKYILSSGEEGNVGTNEINSFLNEIELQIMKIGSSGKAEQIQSATASDGSSVDCQLVSSNFTLTNTASAQNGADPLDIEQMREEYNRIVGVFDTLVTVRDYENFIYNYTYLDGSHAVSNVRVSDRSNDLYGTLNYITLGNNGVVTTVTDNLTVNTDSSSDGIGTDGDTTNEDSANSELTAYTLRLFPLETVSAIDTKEDFDRTFNIPFDSDRVESVNLTAQSVVSDAKCVSHDFAPYGKPILIDYDLEGQIYLKSSVSGTEATLIGQRVESRLLQSLNSRELEWGKMVDYGTVVDIIKSADDRIQYVALNSIVYTNPTEESLDDTFGYDATIRTILAGNKAWTDFSPYAYNYSTEKINNEYFGGVGSTEGPITGITTDVSIDNPDEATSYIVNNNETFTILVPQYNSVIEYGNYLYFIAKSSSDDSPNIVADVPTQLTENQTIYIYQTRTAAEEAISSNIDNALRKNADYVIEPGTIIKSTADIEFSSSPTSWVNMGGSIKITVVERATGTLKPSNNITTSSDLYTLYIATNSVGLRNAFKQQGTGNDNESSSKSYILLSGEYLFYTDAIGAELGIISEGTTLTLSGSGIGDVDDPESGIYLISSTVDVNNLVNGNRDNNYLTTWTQISSRKVATDVQSASNIVYNTSIDYSLNELYTFGSDYLIEFLGNNPTDKIAAFEKSLGSGSGSSFHKNFEPLANAGTNVTGVRYQLLTVPEQGSDQEITVNDSAWEYLDNLMADDPYQYLVRMSFVAGPGVEQEITQMSGSVFSSVASKCKSANTSQSVTMYANSGSALCNATIGSGNSAQATSLLMYPGGLEETYSVNSNIGVMYRTGRSDTTTFSSGFAQISTIIGKNSTIYFPGGTNQVAIFPYITGGTGIIGYGAVRNGEGIGVSKPGSESSGEYVSIKINNDSSGKTVDISAVALGIPRVANMSAKVYKNDGTEDTIGNIFASFSANNSDDDPNNDVNIVSLGTEFIYVNGFYPLQTVDANYAINNPKDANSYFMSNHPYNRYVMPHLNNYNKLIISPMSILN